MKKPYSEKQINKLAFNLSLTIHIIIIFFYIPALNPKINLSVNKYQKPVQLEVTLISSTPKTFPKETKAVALKELKNSKKTKVKSVLDDRAIPLLSQQGQPIYPKSALNAELTGRVLVKAFVNDQGKPEKINVIKSSGHEILDTSFIETIKKYYIFKPKVKDGKAVAGEIELEYTYSL